MNNMRCLRRAAAATAFLAVCCLSASAPAGQVGAASQDALAVAVKNAIQNRDKEALMDLYCWKGVDERTRAMQGHMLGYLFKNKIKETRPTALPQDFRSEQIRSGVRFIPNLPVMGMIRLEFLDQFSGQGTSSSIPFGKEGEQYYLVNIVRGETASQAADSKSLSVIIQGAMTPEPVEFEGIYEYTAGGAKKTESFSGKGNISKPFFGQRIEGCTVRKTSDGGWIQLIITEGGERVFESEKMEMGAPIVYKAGENN